MFFDRKPNWLQIASLPLVTTPERGNEKNHTPERGNEKERDRRSRLYSTLINDL